MTANDTAALCCHSPPHLQARYASLLGKDAYPSDAGAAGAAPGGYERYAGRPGIGAYSYSEYV